MEEEGRADFHSDQFIKIQMVLEGLELCAQQCHRSCIQSIDTLYREMRHRMLSRLDTMSGASRCVVCVVGFV